MGRGIWRQSAKSVPLSHQVGHSEGMRAMTCLQLDMLGPLGHVGHLDTRRGNILPGKKFEMLFEYLPNVGHSAHVICHELVRDEFHC